MAFYLIKNNQILGKVDSPDAWEGWQIAEGEDAPLEDLHWDGGNVVFKPPQPSPEAYWGTNGWIIPSVPEITLQGAIDRARGLCLSHWSGRIAALTAGYPDTEVGTWTDFKQESDRLIASQDLADAPNIYREVMIRRFGPVATDSYCDEFKADYPNDALQMAIAFAERVVSLNQWLLPELTRLKGLRGFHWEAIGKLESVEAVEAYDFTTEA